MNDKGFSQNQVRALLFAHDVTAIVVLGRAVAHLAVAPNVPRAVLMYFIPPTLAFLALIFNWGHGNPTFLAGCRLFLGLIAAAVLVAELPFLPNPPPIFQGIPQQHDRVLFYYFAAYLLFIGLVMPGYFLGLAVYRDLRRQPCGISRSLLYFALATWLLGWSVAVVGMVSRFL